MRFDEGPPRAAPAIFPYPGHGTLADVWGIATPALREVVKLSLDNEERLARLDADKAFERYLRGEW